MNYDETLVIMGALKAAYPSYYRDMKRGDAEQVVNLWAEMFRDEPAELVAAAVKAHIASDRKGFPPHIGAIKDAIVKLTVPEELEMSEMEAWALVRKAINGASMEPWSRLFRDGVLEDKTSAERNFERLPEAVRRVVGSPEQLAEWAKLDANEIETVLQSNFMRSWKARAAKEREYLAIPSAVRETMEKLSGKIFMGALEGGGIDGQPAKAKTGALRSG